MNNDYVPINESIDMQLFNIFQLNLLKRFVLYNIERLLQIRRTCFGRMFSTVETCGLITCVHKYT